MSKILNRLLVFFIGVPLIVSFTFISVCDFLPLQLLVLFFSALTSIEFSNLLGKKMAVQNPYLVLVLAYLIIFSVAIQYHFNLPSEFITCTIFLCLFISFSVEIFNGKSAENNFSVSIEKITSTLLILLYSGYFFSFITKMTLPSWLESQDPVNTSLFLCLFLVIVFGTDSLAWLFGMLFGKNNRGLIKASPNKSIAGFVGGIFGTILVVFIITRFFPGYSVRFANISNIKIFLITFITSIVAIIGDLLESVIKRSANVKDSGTIIPGRGGILDSVDSMLLAAPVFYLLVKIL